MIVAAGQPRIESLGQMTGRSSQITMASARSAMYVPNWEPSYAVRQPHVRSPASEVTAQIRCHGASISTRNATASSRISFAPSGLRQ